jgi:hypothetical protein
MMLLLDGRKFLHPSPEHLIVSHSLATCFIPIVKLIGIIILCREK